MDFTNVRFLVIDVHFYIMQWNRFNIFQFRQDFSVKDRRIWFYQANSDHVDYVGWCWCWTAAVMTLDSCTLAYQKWQVGNSDSFMSIPRLSFFLKIEGKVYTARLGKIMFVEFALVKLKWHTSGNILWK